MRKLLCLIALAIPLAGCSKSPDPTASATPATPVTAPADNAIPAAGTNDALQQKLVEFAGSGATNCGRLNSQVADQLKAASSCATQASESKHPFYVAYDMPGMTVGVAGNSEGNLFTAQAEGSAGLTSGACPSQLRVAPSGRVTCFAPGDMGSTSGHGGVSMPSGSSNPHGTGKPQ